MRSNCPFCEPDSTEKLFDNSSAYAVNDRFPVSQGHMLVIPHRHVADYFELTKEEIAAVHELLKRCREHLDRVYHPDGYNIGVNVGAVAGQTIFHVHIHVIPRYRGDHPAPRGGIRHVIPGKGNY
jgi:diadenosine tetraphosphate (Ap4A) HIT family hydrolase